MPVDYSKWDALELSDDSDVEVHPNVDKRSFIKAKQNQIHQERAQRKHEIETLKYERVLNEGLMKRISSLLAALKSHAAEAESGSRNPGEVAFQAVMESAPQKKEDDMPPPRPEGVHSEQTEPTPSYSKMMATLLDQVNKELDEEKKPKPEDRYKATVEGVQGHLDRVQDLQKQLFARMAELEKLEGKKITSETYRTGFDSSHVAKAVPGEASSGKATEKQDSGKTELLNPNFNANPSAEPSPSYGEDEEIEASNTAKLFAQIPPNDYAASLSFLSKNPEILTERETDGILVLAFDAAIEGKDDDSRRRVHQALLLQYCRALGRDGVQVFFKRITTPGHQAREAFGNDVQGTYLKIRNRAREIAAQRKQEAAEGGGEGVEQIQLHAVEPGTEIKIRIPPTVEESEADAKVAADVAEKEGEKAKGEGQDDGAAAAAEGEEDAPTAAQVAEANKAARLIFEGFSPEFRAALETGSLDKVNEVLGQMSVADAEDVVSKLGDAGILSLEEKIIDATTDEGKKALKELEAVQGSEKSESGYAPDPE